MKRIIVLTLSVLLILSSCIALYAAEPRVVKVGAFNYYPGIFKDTDGVVKGFYVDALADIAQRENIRFEYVYGSWSEGLERIKSGEVDVLTSVAFTSERAEYLDYAKIPLLTVWGELYAPLASEIDHIGDARGKKIAVMKNDFNARHFIELVKKFNITCEFVEVPGFDDVFKAVASKRVDLGVASSTFGAAKQKEFGLRSTGVVFNPFDIFFAVSKGKNQDLLELLDNNLASWRHDQNSVFNLARQKWSHGTIGTMHIYPRWITNIAMALGTVVLGSIVFIILLRRQVRLATADILKSKAVELESEAKFRSYIDNSPDGVLVADENGRYVEVNRAASAITGYSKEELLRMSIPDLIPQESLEIALNHFQNLKDTGFSNCEFEYLHKTGKQRWWSVDAVKLSATRYLGFVKDISERKQSEKELQDKNAELERFTYNVSHDLKSPLITIQTYAGSIKQDIEAGKLDRAQGDIKRITEASEKMTALLSDLLELSRAGRVMNLPSEVNMNRLVTDVLKQLTGSVTQSQVEVVVQSDLPPVCGDRRRLAEVVQNLIENAIKYMGDQPAPRIEIGARQEDKECIFVVSDNGKGIETNNQERIFGLFNKLDTHSEGTGVGLALVKRIIEVHGGRVWVESEGVGKGSRFCFTVPQNLS